MSGQTSTDVAGMVAAHGNFQHALDQVSAFYHTMTEQQAALAANWSGETAWAFGAALERWLEDFGTVRSELAKMTETLAANTGAYARTNEASTQVASSFSGSLSGVSGLGI